MTYKELKKQAERIYDNYDSYVEAEKEIRKFIAENIDKCSDKENYSIILDWPEYKEFKRNN
jgi:hypothetical protein